MSRKLSDADRRAVDLFMQTRAAAANGGGNGNGNGDGHHNGTPHTATAGERLRSVERLMQLLDALPAADPPRDLAGRTLRRLEELTGEPVGTAQPQAHPYVTAQRPA